jgi:hypothetical protein
MELGPRPPRGKLPPEPHVERTAVERLAGKYGAKGGLVTTSGGACVDCSQVWHDGDFPTWLHLMWQQFF